MTLIAALFAIQSANATKPTHIQVRPNCLVTVTSTLKNGEKTERVFRLHEKTEAECRASTELHKKNFAPQTVRTRSATYRWLPSKENP